jgi:hypothetical protein
MRKPKPPRSLLPVIEALAAAADDAPVGEILLEHKVTPAEFIEMDERPGRWGYQINGREWHYKLRRFRNRQGSYRIGMECLKCGHRWSRGEPTAAAQCPKCLMFSTREV